VNTEVTGADGHGDSGAGEASFQGNKFPCSPYRRNLHNPLARVNA